MLKKILIVGLALLVIAAVGVSAYNTGAFAALGGPEPQAYQNAGEVQSAQMGQGPAWQTADDTASGPPWGIGVVEAPAGQQQASNGVSQNAVVAESASQVVANRGGGRGSRGGNAARGSAGSNGMNEPQAVAPEWVTYTGTVQSADSTGFDILTDAGEIIWVDSGNQYFVQNLGLSVQPGDVVTVTGYWMDDTLAAAQVTLASTGEVFVMRDEYGRPLWAGGPRN